MVAETVGPNGTLFAEFVEFLVVAVLVARKFALIFFIGFSFFVELVVFAVKSECPVFVNLLTCFRAHFSKSSTKNVVGRVRAYICNGILNDCKL